jgi:hypothetical protein
MPSGDEDFDNKESQERLWCSTLDVILQRLEQKRAQISQFDHLLPVRPKNAKQTAANMYRNGQVRILDELIGELDGFLGPIERDERSMEESFDGVWERWQLFLIAETGSLVSPNADSRSAL